MGMSPKAPSEPKVMMCLAKPRPAGAQVPAFKPHVTIFWYNLTLYEEQHQHGDRENT
jgi:hypothetical protein